MARYRFRSVWVLRAPTEAVYDALHDYQTHTRWWPGVADAGLLSQGDHKGVGSVLRYVVKGPLPYSLEFEVVVREAVRPTFMSVTASGELVGRGEWRLESQGELSIASYTWAVATTKPWMNIVATPARPLFSWAHGRVMTGGAKGLARHLEVELIAETSSATNESVE